jgi:hypothetical protein
MPGFIPAERAAKTTFQLSNFQGRTHAYKGVDWRRQLGGIRSVMDQSQAPAPEALADYHRSGSYGFSPPAVIDCLRSGPAAGMTLPDPTAPTAQQFRVIA